jgi:single-strand DNA-binding protein
MSSMNRVFLMGKLTRDPAVRNTPGGVAVSDLGLAVSDTYRNKAGEEVQSVCYADVVVWGRQAEACGHYLAKGSPVMVEGRLQLDQWQTEAGEKRSRLRVRADRVQFLGRPRREDGGGKPSAGKEAVPADEGNGVPAGGEAVGAGEDRLPF